MLCLQVLPFPSQVLYNRVGKCGSRTVVILLRLLAEKHQFNLVSSDIHNKTRLTKHEQVRATWPFSHALTVPDVVTCACRTAAEGRGGGFCCSFQTQSHGGALCLKALVLAPDSHPRSSAHKCLTSVMSLLNFLKRDDQVNVSAGASGAFVVH